MSPTPPDASTLRRLRGAMGKIRSRGIRWLCGRLLLELQQPMRLPGKLWRSVTVITYAGGLGIVRTVLRPFTGRPSIYVFYDLQVSPITFDICWPLATAELLRRERGLRDIHFVFVPGLDNGLRTESPDYEFIVDHPARRWRMAQILIPMLQFLPTVTGFTVCKSRASATFLKVLHYGHVYPDSYWPRLPIAHKPSYLLDAARNGRAVSLPLRAPENALRYIDQWLGPEPDRRKTIVVTLREYAFMPQRNSNIVAWAEFARRLDPEVYRVVFVPDTEVSMNEPPDILRSFEFLKEAAWNLGIRMALYESAYLNLMVNNGPHLMCMFNERCRYVMFKILTESAPQTTREYMEFLGFDIGQSPPFSTRFQKWVWEDDRLEIVEAEFAAMCDAIEAHETAG